MLIGGEERRLGDFVGQVGGHLFWRNPETALFGVYGEFVSRDNPSWDTWRVGVQGEVYLGNVSLEGIVGYEDTNFPTGISDAEDVFAYADVAYYFTDDFRVAGGYRRLDGRDIGALGMEYQLQSSLLGGGTSLFAEWRVGTDEYAAVWGGVRIYLGQDKSLIRRHREDDPGTTGDDNLPDVLPKRSSSPPPQCDPEVTFCGTPE